MPQSRIRQAYQTVLSTAAGREVLDDLVTFSQQCGEPVRALGRADVVLRLLREQKRARISESENGTEQEN